MKVYCNNCQHFQTSDNPLYENFDGEQKTLFEMCNSPMNIRNGYKQGGPISIPSIINRFNTCPWYLAKGDAPSPDPDPSDSPNVSILKLTNLDTGITKEIYIRKDEYGNESLVIGSSVNPLEQS